MSSRANRVLGSARWAAIADASGFITELASEATIAKRLKGRSSSDLPGWERRVGGRYGSDVDMLPGAYSDDTQLRLAVCRSIRDDGRFDVDAFAKVELPVWRAYYLGAGRGSKAAAKNLCKSNVASFSNFFVDRSTTYLNGGGNGAAMRAQPHAWKARSDDPTQVVTSTMLDAVCTHGHPRGFLGAVFHSLCVHHAIESGRIPGPEIWNHILEWLGRVPSLVDQDERLGILWRTEWERQSGSTLEDAVRTVVAEVRQAIRAVTRIFGNAAGDPRTDYDKIIDALQLRKPEIRGSGTLTALAAAALAWMCHDKANLGVQISSDALGTDTDSIGTMYGAIVGVACWDQDGPRILDDRYVTGEALRLARVSRREPAPNFPHPNLLDWSAPATAFDLIGHTGSHMALAGLGSLGEPLGNSVQTGGRHPAVLEWRQLPFGQTVLVRRRAEGLGKLSVADVPDLSRYSKWMRHAAENRTAERGAQADLFATSPTVNRATAEVRHGGIGRDELEDRIDELIAQNFDPTAVGEAILQISMANDGVVRSGQLAALIAMAIRSRARRGRR